MKLHILLLLLFSISIFAQPTIDGDMSDSHYSTISTFTSDRNGFGSDNDLGAIKFYTDGTDIYLGVTGETTSNDNIVIFFDFSGYTGRGTNTLAGSSTSSIGVFTTSSGGLDGAIMDFDVDFALAFNEGNSSTNYYCDAARFGSGSGGYLSTAFIGNSGSQSGSSGSFNLGGTFGGTGNITFAYNNTFSSNSDKGVEMKIPIAVFSGVTNTQTLRVFVLITSSTGFCSNECIPGDPGASNLGNDPNFSSISGQDFFTGSNALPVELNTFSAKIVNNFILLNWQTVTEVNNYGFEIERSTDKAVWNKIGFVQGAGNSNSPKNYSYTDNTAVSGKYFYRLKQLDTDGTFDYSPVAEVDMGLLPGGYRLEQNYPNPFNPSTNIKFAFSKDTKAAIKVYNALGIEVREIFNGVAEAGRVYDIQFNAAGLSSGVYYYKLITPEKTDVRKMMLTK